MRGNKLHRALDRYVGRALISLLAALPRRPAPDPKGREHDRILVVKLAALGDVVLMVPALRALRARYPGATIGMVGTAVNRPIAEELAMLIDEFHILEVGRVVREPGYLRAFTRGLARGEWQLGIDFDQWTHVTPLLLERAGIPVRIGFRTPSAVRHRLYTHTRPRARDRHEAANFLSLLEPLGIHEEVAPIALPIRVGLAERSRARLRSAGWNGSDALLFIHPGCGHAHARAWPADSYRELCRRLRERRDAFLVITGAGAERALATELAGIAPGRATALTDTSIPELIAALSLADIVLSGNTGVMHLAAGVGARQLVLEGPNDPAKWGPINPDAVILRSSCPGCPCLDMGWEFHRTDGYCMAQIAVEEVLETLARMLDGSRRPTSGVAG